MRRRANIFFPGQHHLLQRPPSPVVLPGRGHLAAASDEGRGEEEDTDAQGGFPGLRSLLQQDAHGQQIQRRKRK